MSRAPLPAAPGVDDFRALAQSSPWRFSSLHFTHHQGRRGEGAGAGGIVESWLDRHAHRVRVRAADGVEVAEGVPYSLGGSAALRPVDPTLRSDGLVAVRATDWHLYYGDPMWRDYQWTAMLDPVELSYGVEVQDVVASIVQGRSIWSAVCRPLMGEGQDWHGGYDPRCGCCPLLDSPASRSVEYGPDDARSRVAELPTTFLVQLDVQTAIAVQIDALDGWGGTVLRNEIHDVDLPLRP